LRRPSAGRQPPAVEEFTILTSSCEFYWRGEFPYTRPGISLRRSFSMRGILAVLGGVMFSLAATFTAQAEVSTTYHELVEGNPKAKLTVVEYASLTCPHCAKFYVE